MNEITQIKETCLYMEDLLPALHFYHEQLGFEVIHHEKDKHLFLRAGSSILLCFNPRDSRLKTSPPPHFAKGPQHLAFEVAPEDYEVSKEKVLRAGIVIIDKVRWPGGQESFYFNDPAGNVLEIVPRGVWTQS